MPAILVSPKILLAERCSRSGSLCAEAGQRAAAPFPAPLSLLAAAILRFAPDRFLLTKPNAFPHNRVASVATLRWCSGSSRNAVRLPFGTAFSFAGIPIRKLIRLCEELNSSYDNGNYYATAMLTRGLLDHVPPLFDYAGFAQVANNYGGGGRSFKETMQHLEGASRKIGDGHLHVPIRKSETLPTPQQVYCGSQLDVLLAEIVRISK